jgi:hypothetical protein
MSTNLLAPEAKYSTWRSPDELFEKTRTSQDRLSETSTTRALIPYETDVVVADHQAALDTAVEERSRRCLARGSKALLNELFERGFAWSGIARLLKVSVPALRKWRLGESEPTFENRRSIAKLVAFSELLEKEGSVENVASWLEMPFVEGYNVDGFDLFLSGHTDLVYQVAARRMGPREALDQFAPDWRHTMAAGLEAFVAGDGSVAVRPKN